MRALMGLIREKHEIKDYKELFFNANIVINNKHLIIAIVS